MAAGRPFRLMVSPLVLIVAIALASAILLSWMGWRLIGRERQAELQQRQQQLEEAADRIAANLREALAAESVRLGAWSVSAPDPAAIPEGTGFSIIDGEAEAP